ncbi:hypothetical protein [Microbulbifer mangrovi]|uniref:hypothetical protein n=1 Tax=Microbulbifer mangrovi TaxID=927787 RepID=UPI000990653B|nr:hypothetical protein [Microbulbifer mangrovi]
MKKLALATMSLGLLISCSNLEQNIEEAVFTKYVPVDRNSPRIIQSTAEHIQAHNSSGSILDRILDLISKRLDPDIYWNMEDRFNAELPNNRRYVMNLNHCAPVNEKPAFRVNIYDRTRHWDIQKSAPKTTTKTVLVGLREIPQPGVKPIAEYTLRQQNGDWMASGIDQLNPLSSEVPGQRSIDIFGPPLGREQILDFELIMPNENYDSEEAEKAREANALKRWDMTIAGSNIEEPIVIPENRPESFFSICLPEGDYTFSITAKDGARGLTETKTESVTINDILVVGFGDSMTSGEGTALREEAQIDMKLGDLYEKYIDALATYGVPLDQTLEESTAMVKKSLHQTFKLEDPIYLAPRIKNGPYKTSHDTYRATIEYGRWAFGDAEPFLISGEGLVNVMDPATYLCSKQPVNCYWASRINGYYPVSIQQAREVYRVEGSRAVFRWEDLNPEGYQIPTCSDLKQETPCGRDPQTIEYSLYGLNKYYPVAFDHFRSHRSPESYVVKVARKLEQRSDKTSVTIINLAASGASFKAGINGKYHGAEGESRVPMEPQTAQLRHLVGKISDNGLPSLARENVDTIIMSAGINDGCFSCALAAMMARITEPGGVDYWGGPAKSDVKQAFIDGGWKTAYSKEGDYDPTWYTVGMSLTLGLVGAGVAILPEHWDAYVMDKIKEDADKTLAKFYENSVQGVDQVAQSYENLESTFKLIDVPIDNLFTLAYPDITRYNGQRCSRVLDFMASDVNSYAGPVHTHHIDTVINHNELITLEEMRIELNEQVEAGVEKVRSAGNKNWHYLNATSSALKNGGLCAPESERLVNSIGAKVLYHQGSINGIAHPNKRGHDVLADVVYGEVISKIDSEVIKYQ